LLIEKLKAMNNSISQKSELSEIKQEASLFFKEVVNALFELSLFLYNRFAVWLKKVGEDYTIENVKNQGLTEILYRRAALFFGINEEKLEKTKAKRKRLSRRIFKKAVLLPLYLLITLVHSIVNYQLSKNKPKKMNKKVNYYKI